MTDRSDLPTGVPILDYGVTIPRDGYSVVLLDGGHASATLADTVESVLGKLFGPHGTSHLTTPQDFLPDQQ